LLRQFLSPQSPPLVGKAATRKLEASELALLLAPRSPPPFKSPGLYSPSLGAHLTPPPVRIELPPPESPELTVVSDILSDLQLIQANITPRPERQRYFASQSAITLDDVRTWKGNWEQRWEESIKAGEPALVVDPSSRYEEVLERLRWKRNRHKKLSSLHIEKSRVTVYEVLKLFKYRECKAVIQVWLNGMNRLRQAETGFFQACSLTKALCTMRWIMTRWVGRNYEDAFVGWHGNAHREVRILKRQEVHACRIAQNKAKASQIATALLENMGSLTYLGEGGSEVFMSVTDMQKCASHPGPFAAFAAWMLADHRREFNRYDFDLGGRNEHQSPLLLPYMDI